jgi:hypothetical protein
MIFETAARKMLRGFLLGRPWISPCFKGLYQGMGSLNIDRFDQLLSND